MNCAVVDTQTLIVLNVIVADETDPAPDPGTILIASPDANGRNARVGYHYSADAGFEQPFIDGPFPSR